MLMVGGPHKGFEGASLQKRVKEEDLLCPDERSHSPDLIRTFKNEEDIMTA